LNFRIRQTVSGLSLILLSAGLCAAEKITIQFPDSGLRLAPFIEMVMAMTIVAVLPALLLMCTSFVRILIVFSILRNALGTGRIPPNAVLIMLALMLTVFIMMPTMNQLNEKAVSPYLAGNMDYKTGLSEGENVMCGFMLKYVQPQDLELFQNIAKKPMPKTSDEAGFFTVAPAFMLSEMRRGFTMGFLLYIPFLLIDLIAASVLMSMGMMMLPPVMVSLPFKLLLFVMFDGWRLLVESLVKGFSG
jgi:flagellar biosynthetic protein FliP